MKTQITLPLNRKIQIEMMKKNLSRRYVRKKLRMKKSLFSHALSGNRIAALNRVVCFVRRHKASLEYLTK